MLPSAETVGLSSAKSEFTFTPKFSILRMVEAVMMLSFCGFKTMEVSKEGWAAACNMQMHKMIDLMVFTAKDLPQNNKRYLLIIALERIEFLYMLKRRRTYRRPPTINNQALAGNVPRFF